MTLHAGRVVALPVAAFAVTAILLAGVAPANSVPRQQRIAIAFDQKSGTFVLTPLAPGPLLRDSGRYASCCWTTRYFTRDGQSIEIDDPTVTFTGKRGTFTWHERITFVDINNGYTVATATWTITSGTGAYTHLEGHGREAAVNRVDRGEVAATAEGLFFPTR